MQHFLPKIQIYKICIQLNLTFTFVQVNIQFKMITKQSILECQICYQGYNLKKRCPTIICGNRHIMCRQCIQNGGLKLEYQLGAQTGNYRCPICNQFQFIPRWKQFGQCNLTYDFITLVENIEKQCQQKLKEQESLNKRHKHDLQEKIDILNQCNTFLKNQNFSLGEQVSTQEELKIKHMQHIGKLNKRIYQLKKDYLQDNLAEMKGNFQSFQEQVQNYKSGHVQNIVKNRSLLLSQRKFRVHQNKQNSHANEIKQKQKNDCFQQGYKTVKNSAKLQAQKVEKLHSDIQSDKYENIVEKKPKKQFYQQISQINICRFLPFNTPNLIQNRYNQPYKIMGRYPLKFDQIHQFEFKILKTLSGSIYFGIGTDELLQKQNSVTSVKFMGRCLSKYKNQLNLNAFNKSGLNQQVYRNRRVSMKIDLNNINPTLQIQTGENLLFKKSIKMASSSILLYPVIVMMDNGDKIQIVSKIF